MLVDTGASITIFDKTKLVSKFKCKILFSEVEELSIHGLESFNQAIYQFESAGMVISGYQTLQKKYYALEFESKAKEILPIDGIIGLDILSGLGAMIDLNNGQIVFSKVRIS